MQCDEGIGIIPMSTGLIVRIDHDNIVVGFTQQGVGKSHTHGARADD